MHVPSDTPKSFLKRRRITLMCLVVAFGTVAVGGIRAQRSLHDLRSICNQAIREKRPELIERKIAEEKAEAQRQRAERKAEYARLDASAQSERLKWTQVIETSTAAMRTKEFTERQLKPKFRLVGHQPSSEVNEDDAGFWSFQQLDHVAPPQIANSAWCQNPIDQFVFARLEAAGLSPNTTASRQVQARRLWFDLIGLPPSPDEIGAFVDDDRPEAYEQLVDELLSKPGFGERWGRVWLDLARYADSNGYEEDEIRPHAYPYRDFVIWAMNIDLPYNLFLRWQIAGDELAADNPVAVAASGFFTAAPLNTFIPQESERFDELDNMVSTMSSAMLGLTVGCARCHDHKYDPIPTSEYYSLVSIFSETSRKQSYLVTDGGKEYRQSFDPVDERRQEIKRMLKDRIKEDNISDLDYFTDKEKDLLRQPIDPDNEEQERLISLCERCLLITDDHLSDDTEPLPKDRARFDELKSELERLEPLLPTQPPMGLTLTGSNVSMTHILEGGDLKRKEGLVGPGFLAAVTKGRPSWDKNTWKAWARSDRNHGGDNKKTAKPRSALAYWMTDVDQGAGALSARVIVNRLWQHHFGVGLVRTSSDFGNEGEEPSHPELLDWLANELIDNDWSLKHIHRLIVTSATYRQSSLLSEEKHRIDPLNRLVGRHAPQRLTAEMMRDTMLFTAGKLNRDLYGPGVKPPIPRAAVYNTQQEPEDTWPCDYEADRPALWRRSIYVMLKRTVPVPMLRLFDAPDGSFSCQQRKKTNVPTQALALWNAPFVITQAERLARRITAETTDPDDQVRQLFMLTLSRLPIQREIALALEFCKQEDQQQRFSELCHVLLMSNEFSYVE